MKNTLLTLVIFIVSCQSYAQDINCSSVAINYNNVNGQGISIFNSNNLAYSTLQVNGSVGYSVPNWANSIVFESVPVSTGGFVLSSYTGDITFQTNNRSNRMTITAIGNIGIGTTSPTEKLSVKGKIRAQEIKVETQNWPDYVFAKGYQLPTLQETEKHIKENGHLPGIPSAIEVKANGIDLGNMNAKLLQKIEELTLHLIEKDKELNRERLINSNQEERLRKLELNNQQK